MAIEQAIKVYEAARRAREAALDALELANAAGLRDHEGRLLDFAIDDLPWEIERAAVRALLDAVPVNEDEAAAHDRIFQEVRERDDHLDIVGCEPGEKYYSAAYTGSFHRERVA